MGRITTKKKVYDLGESDTKYFDNVQTEDFIPKPKNTGERR